MAGAKGMDGASRIRGDAAPFESLGSTTTARGSYTYVYRDHSRS
jgi:hypothetical protein